MYLVFQLRVCLSASYALLSLFPGERFLISVSGPGYLILDDVIIPKPFAHWMSAAYMDYDNTQKRHIICQRIVIVIWTNGFIIFAWSSLLIH